jgi:serine protease Do
VIVKPGLALARAWILLVHAAGCAKRENPESDNRQRALPTWIVFSQLKRPTNSGPYIPRPGGQSMKPARTRRLLAAGLIGAVATLTSATGASAEPVNPETFVAERTNPAVQLVFAEYTATVSVRPTDFNSAGVALIDRAYQKYTILELPSLSDVIEYTFERIANNPTRYLREFGDARSKTLHTYYSGTGWVADPSGYLVTAKHVVTPDAEVKQSFTQQGVKEFATAEANSWIKALKEYDLSNNAKNSIKVAVSKFYAEKLKVRVAAPKVSVMLGTAAADGSREGKEYPADVVYRSGSAAGEDVAVVKIHVDGQLPSLPLATAAAVQGDPIFLDAFPALPDDSEAAALQPTLTGGQITAIKPNRAGIQLLQINSVTGSGASGGPGLNSAGEVIGILVSSAVDSNGNRIGENYLMPLDSVRDALTRSGATPTPGQTTVVYNQGLADFYANHYSRALEEFRQVKELFPAHAYVGSYISRAQLAISQGKDVPIEPPRKRWLPSPLPSPLVLVAGGAVLLTLSGGALAYGRSRRRQNRATVEMAEGNFGTEPNPYASVERDPYASVERVN